METFEFDNVATLGVAYIKFKLEEDSFQLLQAQTSR
jgi:hypothetical protein